MKGKNGWFHRNNQEISECERVTGKNGENEKYRGDRETLVLFVNEKFDEMGKKRSFHRTFSVLYV